MQRQPTDNKNREKNTEARRIQQSENINITAKKIIETILLSSRLTEKTQPEMALNIDVEVSRTINTPKGRRFPPREPKTFSLTLAPKGQKSPQAAEDEYVSLEEQVKQNFPGLQGQFTLYWKDSQGELLLCNNDEQLMKALDGMTSEALQIFVQREHTGRCNVQVDVTQCSECHVDIKGLRTKCLQCPDYNLCTDCDLKGIHDTHVMVRCARPRFFNFALPWFNAVIPQMCEEIMEKNKDNKSVPRISPMDVRQFWQRQKKQDGKSTPESHAMEGGQQRGQNMQEERRKQMKRMWHGFLANIAVEGGANNAPNNRSCPRKFQKQWGKCQESVDKTNQEKMAEGEAGNLAEKLDDMDLKEPQTMQEMRPRLQQLKRQWMQKSIQQWRQQMRKGMENKDDQDKPLMSFGLWRPYMRNCWDHWQQLSSAEGIDPKDCPWMKHHRHQPASQGDSNSEGQQGPINPRRQWIQSCWKMWRDDAAKLMQKESSSDEENTMQRGCAGRHAGRPFPGYHILMNKSWRLMLEQMKPRDQHDVTQEDKESCETSCAAEGNQGGIQNMDAELVQETPKEKLNPEMAKQMLKMCWVNGCRQIWWMQVKKLKEGKKSEEKSNVDQNELEPKQSEIWDVMMKQPKWRAYMQQCWVLWRQLCKRSGMNIENAVSAKELKESDDDTEMDLDRGASLPQPHNMKPKQSWLIDTWKLFQEDIAKIRSHENGDHFPKWEKRPFFGWRQVMLKSWDMMQTHFTPCHPTEGWEEMTETCMQNMRDRWARKNKQHMQNIQVKDGAQKDDQTANSKIGPQGAEAETSNTTATWQEKREQLVQNLMEQYWHMLAKRQDVRNHGPGKISCHEGWRRHGHVFKKPRHDLGCSTAKCPEHNDGGADSGHESHHGARLRLKLSMRQTPTNKQ